MAAMIVGVDTGGTFTDFALQDSAGGLRVCKVPSTPDDPSEAILEGLRRLPLTAGFWVAHGTTVATNALLERRGAKTALLTTQGCRDVLEIARQTRAQLYCLTPRPRDPLIPRDLRYEVPERLDRKGAQVVPLDAGALERVLDAVEAQGVESLAVCFLFSFLNPQHEKEAGRQARARGLHVSLSCEVAPEYREYERTSTVCANAFVAPIMSHYIGRLQARIGELEAGRLSVMQSNGGTLRAEEAAANAIKTVLSGPAGGLVAAARIAKEAGVRRIMTFDMGGTSTDVALIDGAPETVRTGEVAGLPLLTPMLDIHTVGAGGGSLARIDAGGGVRVGPQSAGADPGPVACGRGERLTVTDAHVLLGRLPASLRLAGRLPLDADRVAARFAVFAQTLGLSAEAAAEGVLEVANAQMARALRHISVERGRDPSDYTLVSFGGAGGLHACALAEAVGARAVLVPRYPGAFSALGLALAEARREYQRTLFVPAQERFDPLLAENLRPMAAQARAEMEREGIPPDAVFLEPFVEARYVGQSYALRVPFRRRLALAAKAFHRAHRARYGHADPTQPVEIVTVGLTVVGANRRAQETQPPAASLLPHVAARSHTSRLEAQTTRLWERGGWRESRLYAREMLEAGLEVCGPALIVQEDATTYLPSDWIAAADARGNLHLRRGSGR
jgi:N-methylhydantoinase A